MAATRARLALTDGDLRQACLRVATMRGIDAVGIPQVAAEAGVTSAPVYRRFDSGDDLIADLWAASLRERWRRAGRAAANWSRTSDDTDWLAAEITAPSSESHVAIEAICVARRLGPAGATVRADFEHDLSTLIADASRLPPTLVIASLTPVLGAWLIAPVAPRFPESVVASYERFAGEYRRTEHWTLESTGIPYVPPPQLRPGQGDAALDDLRRAAILTVSQFGMANTTTNRIARRAGRSLNTAYRRLGSKDELVGEAIDMALRSDFGFTGNENAMSMPFSRQDRLERALTVLRHHIDERNHLYRSFMLEALLAARHDERLRQQMSAWFASVEARFADAVNGLGDPDLLADLWRFRITSGIGCLVLSLVSNQFTSRYDPMPAISANDAVVAATAGILR